MSLVAADWNVVILGHWNRAILTPAWIAKTLFDLPEGTPVQVLVSIDTIAPHQVRHEKLTVIAGSDRMIIQPAQNDIETLLEAMSVARKILKELPRTPVSAVGYNLRYKSEGLVESLQQITTHEWDDRLSDSGFKIVSKSISRAVLWKEGKIHALITQETDEKYELLLNFTLESNDSQRLLDWLSVPAEEIRTQASRILQKTIGVLPEELSHA